MTDEPRPGDLVNMTFQTRVGSEAYRLALCNQVSIERVQPADDPSKDPIGTVRRTTLGALYAHVDAKPGKGDWVYVGAGGGADQQKPRLFSDQIARGWEIAGRLEVD